MDWLKKFFGSDQKVEPDIEVFDNFNMSIQEQMEQAMRKQILQEDMQMKEIEEERETEEKAVEGQLLVIDGAKIKLNGHTGTFKVLQDVPSTQGKATGTMVEKQIPNFTFDDGFQLLSINGDWQNVGSLQFQDNLALTKDSIISVEGKMPGNAPVEKGMIGITDSGQVNEPENLPKYFQDHSVEGIWLNTKEEKIEKAILGEELKIKLLLKHEVGTSLTLVLRAKDDGSEISYTKNGDRIRIPFIVPDSMEFITEAIHLNPHYFYRKGSDIAFFFVIEELPDFESAALTFKGFGKPSAFEINKSKSYFYKRKSDGSSVAYVSGVRLDILMYQDWFENGAEELDYTDKTLMDSYFNNVYLTHVFKWGIDGEYGSEENRVKLIKAFEEAGKKHKIAPSILYTYAAGEGMLYASKKFPVNGPISSFIGFGLDFFEKEAPRLKASGYLAQNFKSVGIAIRNYDETYTVPKPFNGHYAPLRFPNNRIMKREEGADKNGPVEVFPVLFKDYFAGIEGACALYARSYKDAAKSAKNVGWGELTLNENVYFGYYKIQRTSTLGNAEVNDHRRSKNFLKYEYVRTNDDDDKIHNKGYHRWVVWRYILLSKKFSS